MTAHLRFDESGGVLHVHQHGRVDANSLRSEFVAIVEEASVRDAQQIVIDARELEGDLSMLDLHKFGKRLAENPEVCIRQIAIICHPADQNYRYIALVARNRGARIRTFKDETEVSFWLRE